MSTQIDGKQILKFYIRLLLYIDDIHNKYRNIEIAKSDSDSDSYDKGYLKFIRRKKPDLIAQLEDNLKYNKENRYGVSIDNTFVRLFKQKEQEPAQTASEVKPEVAEVALEIAQTISPVTFAVAEAAQPLTDAAETELGETGVAELVLDE